MVQDFAKKYSPPTSEQSARPAAKSSGSPTTLLLTGLVTGLALGFFISFLAYLSGYVPPLAGQQGETVARAEPAQEEAEGQLTEELERAAQRLQLEFYRELPNYEVVVDTSPLEGSTPRSSPPPPVQEESRSDSPAPPTDSTPPPGSNRYMLQAGAFQQESAAIAQRDRLIGLGLQTPVRQEALLGRTLFLVQAGPYHRREQLGQAERVLRNNNIDSMRITLGNR